MIEEQMKSAVFNTENARRLISDARVELKIISAYIDGKGGLEKYGISIQRINNALMHLEDIVNALEKANHFGDN